MSERWRCGHPTQRQVLTGKVVATVLDMDFTADSPDIAGLRRAKFAFPGPLRDKLVRAILDGHKVSTTGLAREYELGFEPWPEVGQRSVVVDSADRPVAVIETTDVRVVPLARVDIEHAIDEGEDHASLAEWRRDHEAFWHSPEMRSELNDPTFCADDDTPVVLELFRVIALAPHP